MPHRLHRDVTADVIAPHQGNMIAEFRHEKIDEATPMTVFLHRHLVEHLGAGRIIVVQAVSEIGENARVLLLVADGEGQNLAFGAGRRICAWIWVPRIRLVDLSFYRRPPRSRALKRGPSRGAPSLGSRRSPGCARDLNRSRRPLALHRQSISLWTDVCLVLTSPRSRSRK